MILNVIAPLSGTSNLKVLVLQLLEFVRDFDVFKPLDLLATKNRKNDDEVKPNIRPLIVKVYQFRLTNQCASWQCPYASDFFTDHIRPGFYHLPIAEIALGCFYLVDDPLFKGVQRL